MAYNYVVSARKPSAVACVACCSFTGPSDHNMIIVKATRLEIHKITENSLEPFVDVPLNGEVQVMETLRLPGEAQDVIFLCTVRMQFCVLGFDAAKGLIVTRASGSVKDRIGKEVDGGGLGIVDPESRMVGLQLYEGFLKVLPIEPDGSLSDAINIRMEEIDVLDMVFLHGMPKPTIAVLSQDMRDTRDVKTYVVNRSRRDLSEGPWTLGGLSATARLLVAVPAPLGGVLVIAEDAITYRGSSADRCASIAMEPTVIQAFGSIDAKKGFCGPASRSPGPEPNAARILLGDARGRLYLCLLRDGSPPEVHLEYLGDTSIATSIAYLDSGVVFVASSGGDSQLVKLADGGGPEAGAALSVLDVYENIGPITDMCVMDMDRQGQGQLVTCSGLYKDGSLRVVRNGVGVTERASVEMPGIQGLWRLRRSAADAFDALLVIAFPADTRVLSIDGHSMAELDVPQLSRGTTLHVANVGGEGVLRATPEGLALFRVGDAGLRAWAPPGGKRVTVCASHGSAAVVACSGGTVYHLRVGTEGTPGGFEVLASCELGHEVSCINLDPFSRADDAMDTEDSEQSRWAAVGTWEDLRVHLLRLPDLQLRTAQPLGGDTQARSVQLATLGGCDLLLAALGDGTLVAYRVEPACDAAGAPAAPALRAHKRLVLGARPLSLAPFRASDGSTAIFAAGDRPAVLYGGRGSLLCANVNCGEVGAMCPFHCEAFPHSIALRSGESLVVGAIDDIQRLHVSTVPLGEQPRRVCHAPQSHALCVATERSTSSCESCFLRFFDDATLEEFGSIALDPNEMCMSSCVAELPLAPGAPRQQVFVCGTGYDDRDGLEPLQGRVLVVAVLRSSTERQVRVVGEAATHGCVFSLCAFGEDKVLCGVNSEVHLYGWSAPAEEPPALSLLCSHRGHIIVVHAHCRGDFACVGDLCRSVTLLRYRRAGEEGEGSPARLEEIAHDYSASWILKVHMLSDDVVLCAENCNNLFTVRKNADAPSEEERTRLELQGEFHLGDQVNAIESGSLVMREGRGAAAAAAAPEVAHSLLYGTVSGAIGAVLGLGRRDYDFFRGVQNAMAKVVSGVGGLSHSEWRAFASPSHVGGSQYFVDGDLVERFLDLSDADMALVVEKMREAGCGDAEGDLTPAEVLARVEEMHRMH